jgi:hypothetical protein
MVEQLLQQSPETVSQAPSVMLKRQVTIKTLVTEGFKVRAKEELAQEIKVIDSQLAQLESQYQHSLHQLEIMAQQGQMVKPQLDQLNLEAQNKRHQLTSLKLEVSNQLANLDRVENGSFVITGVMESFVNVKVGDNIYEKVQNSEIIVENGVVTSIR